MKSRDVAGAVMVDEAFEQLGAQAQTLILRIDCQQEQFRLVDDSALEIETRGLPVRRSRNDQPNAGEKAAVMTRMTSPRSSGPPAAR